MTETEARDPDMRDEYDFTGGIRGKHYKQYIEGTNLIALDPDVRKMFPDSESVNRALRALGQIITEQRATKPPRGRGKAGTLRTG
jgi:hypothetical protein